MPKPAAAAQPVLAAIIARARHRIAAEQQSPTNPRTAHAASIPERS